MSWAPVSSGGPAVVTAVAAPQPAAAGTQRGYTDRRPGFVPMRPMAMGEILDGAMGMLRHAPGATLGLGVIVSVIQTVLTVPVQWLSQRFTFSAFDLSGNAALDPFLALVGCGLTAIVSMIISTICAGVISGFMAFAVGESSLGRPVTLGGVWRSTKSRMWALVGLSLIIAIAELFGAGVLGIGWLFFTAVFAVAVPALVLERGGVFAAIGRSWNLTIKDLFRVLGIRLLAVIIATTLQFVLALPLAAVGEFVLLSGASGAPSAGRTLLAVFCIAVGAMIGNIVTSPFLGCVSAFLYIDRRMRSEGLDLELRKRAPAPGIVTGAPE